MATENIKFKLELFSTYWDKAPTCEILINNISKWKGEVLGTDDKPTKINFEHTLNENETYKLILDRQGKDISQTIMENGEIKKDQMLHIKSIEIDDINIGALVYEGVYKPTYPEPWASEQKDLPETLKNVTQLGHNGTWTMSFTSPFYMWLLENLY